MPQFSISTHFRSEEEEAERKQRIVDRIVLTA